MDKFSYNGTWHCWVILRQTLAVGEMACTNSSVCLSRDWRLLYYLIREIHRQSGAGLDAPFSWSNNVPGTCSFEDCWLNKDTYKQWLPWGWVGRRRACCDDCTISLYLMSVGESLTTVDITATHIFTAHLANSQLQNGSRNSTRLGLYLAMKSTNQCFILCLFTLRWY